LQAAVLEFREHTQPELGALRLGQPEAEGLLHAVLAYADGEVDARVDHALVKPDLDDQRIEVDDRVDALERPGLPAGDFVHDGVGDFADEAGADLDAANGPRSGG